jgi:hypothetical protein
MLTPITGLDQHRYCKQAEVDLRALWYQAVGMSGMAKSGKPRPGVPRTSIALATLPFLMSMRAASLTVQVDRVMALSSSRLFHHRAI